MKKALLFRISLFCFFLLITGMINAQTITVDGEKDAFYSTLTGPDNGYLQLRSFTSSDNGRPRNDSDLSAKVWSAWDQDWFYIYAEVQDDIIKVNNASNNWANDCLELKFDAQPTDSTVNSIWPVTLTALGHAFPGVTAGAAADSMNFVPDSLKKFSRNKIIPGGYALELALNWKAIGHRGNGGTETNESIIPEEGNVFGLAIMVHDNDAATRKASIQWAAVNRDAAWNTPKLLGTAKLLAGNKVQLLPYNTVTPWRVNTLPYDGSAPTSVKENSVLPVNYALQQNYPNPFNPTTTIRFDLPVSGDVRIELYDILGNVVKEIVNGNYKAGSHEVKLNASGLASGIYFYKLSAGKFVSTKKLILMK